MKIVFMGTPQAAAVSLSRLVDNGHKVVAVYTQPDRPSGRGNRVTYSPVKELGMQHGLNVLQPTKIKTPEALATFRSHNADIVVVVAYGRILPETFLNAFKYGALNVHFSLLPKYRGAAPVNWAIVNGESETGVTVIKMDAGLDTGDILIQESTPIGDEETSVELMERLSLIGAELLTETLAKIDELRPVEQNDDEATFAPIMKKEDGFIDWDLTAVEIERRVRGFQPFPTAYTFHQGGRLTVWKALVAESIAENTAVPGQIIEANGGRLLVVCGNMSVLALQEVQPEGKRRMSVRDFINGSRLQPGDVLTSRRLEAERVKR